MDKITITKNNISLTLPRTRDISFTCEEVGTETEMASGKLVKDIRGYRPVIKASWDYFPAEDLTKLISLLRQGGFYNVNYPDEAGEKNGRFKISYPETKIFKFVNGVPMWHGVDLTFTAQEVISS